MIASVALEPSPKKKVGRMASMVVYGVPTQSERLATEEPMSCKVIATFQFPFFTNKIHHAQISLESSPEPGAASYPRMAGINAKKPFYPDPRKRIFKLSLSIRWSKKSFWGDVESRNVIYTIFVHSDAFWNVLGDDILRTGRLPLGTVPKVIPWNLWSKYARWIPEWTPRDFGTYSPTSLHV